VAFLFAYPVKWAEID